MTKLGRPVKYASDEERLEAKRSRNRVYQRSIKDKRRERYSSDPTYRKKAIDRSREAYRKSTTFLPKNFGVNAGSAAKYAIPVIAVDGVATEGLRVKEISQVMGTSLKVFYSWINTQKFPLPKNVSMDGKPYYTVFQANALGAIVKSELSGRASFRVTDRAVIRKLRERLDQLVEEGR